VAEAVRTAALPRSKQRTCPPSSATSLPPAAVRADLVDAFCHAALTLTVLAREERAESTAGRCAQSMVACGLIELGDAWDYCDGGYVNTTLLCSDLLNDDELLGEVKRSAKSQGKPYAGRSSGNGLIIRDWMQTCLLWG